MMAKQMDFAGGTHAARVWEWLREHVQTEHGRNLVADVLIPCECCGRALSMTEAAYKHKMTRSRASYLVRKAREGLGLPQVDMWGNPT